jgi:hypothetical protein
MWGTLELALGVVLAALAVVDLNIRIVSSSALLDGIAREDPDHCAVAGRPTFMHVETR